MFNFRHPSYYAKIKKENRLTNKAKYDKEYNNEKILSLNLRTWNRLKSTNTISIRANNRDG